MKANSADPKYRAALTFGALGVVYGDIGTSPLYALKESFHAHHNLSVTAPNIYGILSLIFWSLVLVVSVKYLVFIIRADNHGEGGVLALTALISSYSDKSPKALKILTLMGIFGTALLYGDGMITPAISVLSAVEGLEIVTPVLHPYIIPITIAIIIGLFSIQKHGTSVVGKVFGPITLLWFIILAVLGISKIIEHPEILNAMNPMHAFTFFKLNQWNGFVVLGSVFLVVTGGEALYSDLGHFGKSPIRLAWFIIVLPALVLNYFGQGAMLLHHPLNIKNPFYLMAPDWALIPLIILATFSTVIASQALITGVFSITMQAVQLQYVPRVRIKHTSNAEKGQIYVGSVNWVLMISCILLVLAFRSSSNLAAAYGIAVTTTMVITTVLFYFFARHEWKWNPLVAGSICGFFLLIEGSFWSANLLKILHGGWFPLVIGVIIFTVMTTWHKGRELVSGRMVGRIRPLPVFLEEIRQSGIQRVPGVAVYMSGHPDYIPFTLQSTVERYKCMHEHVLLISVTTLDYPHVPKSNRMRFQNVGPQVYRGIIQYGFMDFPDVPQELEGVLLDKGVVFKSMKATFFLGREHILASREKGMALWREKLFSFMSKNSQSAVSFFKLPRSRVVEIGSMIEI